MRVEDLWQNMFRGGIYPGRLIGSAIAGNDLALWDTKGQALGVPVFELLGGRYRDFAECFLAPTYRTALAAAAPNVRDCFRAMTTVHDFGRSDGAARVRQRWPAGSRLPALNDAARGI